MLYIFSMTQLEIVSGVLLFVVVISVESICILPQYIQHSQWTNQRTNSQLTFGATTMTGWHINARGSILKNYTCISNISDVYVFKSDKSYSYFGRNRWLYLCYKVTKISNNLFYFYSLADLDTTIIPNSRMYNPQPDDIPSDSAKTCTFCEFITAPSQHEFHLMRKASTNESLRIPPSLCLPCAASCHDTTTTTPQQSISTTTAISTQSTPISSTTEATNSTIASTDIASTSPSQTTDTQPTSSSPTTGMPSNLTSTNIDVPSTSPTPTIDTRRHKTLCHSGAIKKALRKACPWTFCFRGYIPNMCAKYHIFATKRAYCLECPKYVFKTPPCPKRCKNCHGWKCGRCRKYHCRHRIEGHYSD